METSELYNKISSYIKEEKTNYISKEVALASSCVGLKIFEEPLIGFASAADPMFDVFKRKEAVGQWHIHPKEWLPNAKTVLSIFLPFSDQIQKSNQTDPIEPSIEWLHGRVEGQAFLFTLCRSIQKWLIAQGDSALIPMADERFWAVESSGFNPRVGDPKREFTSTWSERHVAYVAGLGTFGLSKGIITEKGMCGRFCSLITSAEFPPTPRTYTDIYEHCTFCGACIRRCPVNAISIENGKQHPPCSEYLDLTKRKYMPRYGCGKCQVCVPCATKLPFQV